MIIEIKVGRFTKDYEADYHTLHVNDWNEIMRELLDYEQDAEEGNIMKNE